MDNNSKPVSPPIAKCDICGSYDACKDYGEVFGDVCPECAWIPDLVAKLEAKNDPTRLRMVVAEIMAITAWGVIIAVMILIFMAIYHWIEI